MRTVETVAVTRCHFRPPFLQPFPIGLLVCLEPLRILFPDLLFSGQNLFPVLLVIGPRLCRLPFPGFLCGLQAMHILLLHLDHWNRPLLELSGPLVPLEDRQGLSIDLGPDIGFGPNHGPVHGLRFRRRIRVQHDVLFPADNGYDLILSHSFPFSGSQNAAGGVSGFFSTSEEERWKSRRRSVSQPFLFPGVLMDAGTSRSVPGR